MKNPTSQIRSAPQATQTKLVGITLVALGLFLLATGSAQTQCDIQGEYWADVPTSSHDVSIVPANPPDAKFYADAFDFDSRPGAGHKGLGTNYTVSGFLHYPVFFNTSTTFDANAYIEDAFFRFNGYVYLNAGTNNFLVTHDDGVTLFIDGIGLVVNQPAPTPPVNTPFFPVAPSNGFYHFTLQYANIAAAPGVLIWTNNGAVVSAYVCPPTVIVPANNGCTATNVALGTPSAACGDAAITNNAPPNLTFPIGTNSVTWTFYRTNGSYSTCLQKVIVLGGGPPNITCPADVMVNVAAGSCSIPSSQVFLDSPSVNDCFSFSITNNAPASFYIGTNVVTWTVSNSAGRTNSCQQRVIVKDAQPPSITCPADMTVDANPGQCYATGVALGSPVASDNCTLAGVTNDAPAQFPVGTNFVTWVATDPGGNTNTCQQRVIVLDRQPPTINCPANITVNTVPGLCSSNVTFNVTASDNCAGTPVVVSTPASGSSFSVGTTTVISRATDASGNTKSCSFTVTVRDNQPPVITCPGNITVNAASGRCSSNVTFSVTATDLCGAVTNLSSVPSSDFAFPSGTTTVTNTATDASGNSSQCTFTVTVLDTQPPTITCPADVAVTTDPGTNVASNVNLGTPTVGDNCGIAGIANNAPARYPIGTNFVTWTLTDGSGNTNFCQQRVIVSTAPPPQIACPATITVNANAGLCFATGVNLGTPTLTALGCGGVIVTSNAASQFPLGTNVVEWTVTDQCGKSGFCQQKVIVRDNLPPVLTCSNIVLATDSGQCSRSHVIYTVTSGDNCSATLVQTEGLPSGSTFPKGVTTNRFTATDLSGNSANCFFTVTILDAQPPTITCPANLTVTANSGSVATNVSLGTPVTSDNCGVLSVTSNAPASIPVGTNTVTWTVTDTSGNTSSCQQTVVVAGPPQLTCPTDITTNVNAGVCFATGVNLGTPTITSPGCGANVVTSNAPAQFPAGTTTVVWTLTDQCGNQAVCSQSVTVRNSQAPTILCPGNMLLTTDPGRCSRSNVTYAVTIGDNCSGVMLSRLSGYSSGSTFPKGVTTNSFMFTDGRGNSNFCSFTVTVVDTELPQITCPPDITVSTQPGQTYAANVNLGTPTISDNCGVASVSNNAPTIFPAGTNVVTWRVTDASGNTRDCQQRVVVNQICFGQLFASPLDDVVACPCGLATLVANAGSPDPMSFLWRHNGQIIAGATNRALVLYSLKPADIGTYTVEVRTPCRSATNSAVLSLNNGGGANPRLYTSSSGIEIVDDSDANPFPSEIDVQCVPGVVKNVTITLNGFEHAFPSDVGVLLAGPDGNGVVLMTDAGGPYLVSGTTITFSDAATNYVPAQDVITNGIYLPTDYALNEFRDLVTATNLSVFNGIDPNGPWQLYVLDDFFGDVGSIASWRVNIEWQEAGIELLHPKMTDGLFQTEVSAALNGICYAVEGSSDLRNWISLATNAITSGHNLFIDTPSRQFLYQYYRAVKCP